jgi:hypothetical protein
VITDKPNLATSGARNRDEIATPLSQIRQWLGFHRPRRVTSNHGPNPAK